MTWASMSLSGYIMAPAGINSSLFDASAAGRNAKLEDPGASARAEPILASEPEQIAAPDAPEVLPACIIDERDSGPASTNNVFDILFTCTNPTDYKPTAPFVVGVHQQEVEAKRTTEFSVAQTQNSKRTVNSHDTLPWILAEEREWRPPQPTGAQCRTCNDPPGRWRSDAYSIQIASAAGREPNGPSTKGFFCAMAEFVTGVEIFESYADVPKATKYLPSPRVESCVLVYCNVFWVVRSA
ncbi:hypothetical protein C8R44DRAFT_742048 [Mycena epipterygia]|nr:hypothetical protein C8R44DRAFT_742048 [Mycena epipterygia]